MPRRKPKGSIPRARKQKRRKGRQKRVYAPLTPWVCHPLKRPRSA